MHGISSLVNYSDLDCPCILHLYFLRDREDPNFLYEGGNVGFLSIAKWKFAKSGMQSSYLSLNT